jgi:16S rRNA pseudouridine516 synthase
MSGAAGIRLDRYVSQAAGLSRAAVRTLLRRGAVSVDGIVVKSADLHVPAGGRVELEGAVLALPGLRYFMLNKPLDVVCSTSDGGHLTVLGLLDEPRRELLHPVGRLDRDTTGLVLLTDDGQWSHGITAPRRHRDKVYCATLAEALAASAVERFAAGLMLKGEDRATLPARLEILAPTVARVTVQEGRYHQVKRMFAALGNHVTALHREAIGGVVLDPALAPGEYRALREDEVEALR